jgi:primosomal protein N'
MSKDQDPIPPADLDAHYVSCDNCDAIFNAEEQFHGVECQVGHDSRNGYVPSLCPDCHTKARDGQ